jgi:predicted Zn-dependent peptidase
VFNTLFGESMSSRLFQRLREDRGLCYSVYSFRTYFTDVALWTIYASTAPSSTPELLEAINEELGRLHTDPPGESEIEDAKGQLKGNMVLAREDMENRMKRLFRQLHLTGEAVEYETSFRLLSEVNRRDILRLVEQRILPAQFDLLAYGSRRLRKITRRGYTFP